ncbi:MAG: TonB family C-terminal domain protein [Bryobacterales bacterium]|nr:TonB family C-terminal domain protein [Bryobacterales bacterium]
MKPFCWLLVALAAGLGQAGEIARSIPPHVIHQADTEYTPAALAEKVAGVVTLSAVIGVDGTPSEIQVVQGLGKGLDEKAMESVAQWRFQPGTYDGKPVAVKVRMEVHFRLPRVR